MARRNDFGQRIAALEARSTMLDLRITDLERALEFERSGRALRDRLAEVATRTEGHPTPEPPTAFIGAPIRADELPRPQPRPPRHRPWWLWKKRREGKG